MPWLLTVLLAFFVPCFTYEFATRHKHSKSRLMNGPGYDKLAKYLVRQDALLTKALEQLDKEVAVGELQSNRHQYEASPSRHHKTQQNNHFLEKTSDVLFTEVQPYSEDFVDFDEVPVGAEASPEEFSVSGGCRCAGAASEGNAGNSDCKTTFKHDSWCYVIKTSACADAKSTDKMPNFHWSFQACASGHKSLEDPTVETKKDDKQAAAAAESATGHGSCHCAGVKGSDNAGAADCKSTWKSVPWCYVEKKDSSCSDKQTSEKLKTHDWSHEACHQLIAEALQAEEAMSKSACECEGVSGDKNAGASNCMSTWKDVPWCYVAKTSGCNDKMTSKKMQSHDWSHEACGHVVKEMEMQMEAKLSHNGKSSASSCKCAGVSGKNNSGASDCKSKWEDKTWCYVGKSVGCTDAKSSSKMPKYLWSHIACAATKSDAAETDVAHHPVPAAASVASCACADHQIHGMGAAECKSSYDGTGMGFPKAWCYVSKKSGCKDAMRSSSHPKEWNWSYLACEKSVAITASDASEQGAPGAKPATAAQLQAPDGILPEPKPASSAAEPGSAATHQQSPVGAALACRCSESFVSGDGASDCKTMFEDKAWCYLDASSSCNDKRQSSRFPDREWSHMACGRPL